MEMELKTFQSEKSYKEALLRENLTLRNHLIFYQKKINELKMAFMPVSEATDQIRRHFKSITDLDIPGNMPVQCIDGISPRLERQQLVQRANGKFP